MAIYYLKGQKLRAEYCPDKLSLKAFFGVNSWETGGMIPFVRSKRRRIFRKRPDRHVCVR